MATILNIETSTAVCSVALASEGAILQHSEEFRGRNHATVLSDFIKDALDYLARHDMKLDAVAVSIGPGSYTGLRIGLSEAKGLAYALECKLIGVKTLELMTVGVMFGEHNMPEGTLYAPMIDARRMEVYTAVYDLALSEVMAPRPLILDADSYADSLASASAVAFFRRRQRQGPRTARDQPRRHIHPGCEPAGGGYGGSVGTLVAQRRLPRPGLFHTLVSQGFSGH